MKKILFLFSIIMLLLISSCTDLTNNNLTNGKDNIESKDAISECPGAIHFIKFNSFEEIQNIYYNKLTDECKESLIVLDLDKYGFYTDGDYDLLFAKWSEELEKYSAFKLSLWELKYSVGVSYKYADNNEQRMNSDKNILIECYQTEYDKITSTDVSDYTFKLRLEGIEYTKDGETIICDGTKFFSPDGVIDHHYTTDVPLYCGVYDMYIGEDKVCEFNFYCDENSIEYVKELILQNIVILTRD